MDGGPFITAALFCERVLEERDGVMSAIRIVDRLTIIQPEPPFIAAVTAVISLKQGKAVGRYALGLRPEAPSGLQLPVFQAPVNFDGGEGDRGVSVVLPLQLEVEEGLYWFDVLWIDDRADHQELLTRMPLRVVWQPTPAQ
ncbi:hypothetical protein [Baekduia sp.]|jgi:hypothetical protein|uniref:hypothetical protein n=1 Tax=Baekduia sp. TaxID=2600305 RepID=UPI002DF97507|nr:hypothetical protein [Baekduia sp.]